MIGVISTRDQVPAVEEFFELFKTPWEFFEPHRRYDVVLATVDDVPEVDTKLLILFGSSPKRRQRGEDYGQRAPRSGAFLDYSGWRVPLYGTVLTFDTAPSDAVLLTSDEQAVGIALERLNRRQILRIGYDLFDEVRFLLSAGQPPEHAGVPTLDLHIAMVRAWVLGAGIPLVEIPPVPAGYTCSTCLTHDIDFFGIRRHGLDHSTLGFLYRSTIGGLGRLLRGRVSATRLLQMWRAAVSLPLVWVGLVRDYWQPFEWYLRVEQNLPATYFLIPFKGRQGDRTSGRGTRRRATAYDVADLGCWPDRLVQAKAEIAVHGIDAWHSVEKGREELARVADVTHARVVGIRIHWLLRDERTAGVLDRAGFAYDSTVGYNETVGFRSGTAQAFRPFGVAHLLELPIHIHDGALFFPERLNLSEEEAWNRCLPIADHVRAAGGSLTVLWHDRSHGPERFWGEFYARLVDHLKSSNGWFATAADTVQWFRNRRAVKFVWNAGIETTSPVLSYRGAPIDPPLTVRIHRASVASGSSGTTGGIETVDIPWNGCSELRMDPTLFDERSMCARVAGS